MLRKTILITILTTLSLISKAQKITINWGNQNAGGLPTTFLPGSSNDLIMLIIKEDGREITPTLLRYGSKLDQLTMKDIVVADEGVQFNSLLSVKDNLFFFTNIYDKKAKATSFFCQPLDIKSFNAKGTNINLGTFDALKKQEQSTVAYKLSGDSTKILMFGLSPYVKKDAEKYYMSVFNHQMSKLWDKTIQLPYTDKEIVIFGNLVTNDGKVAVLLKHYDNNTDNQDIKKDGKRVPSYTTKLLLYNKDETNPHEFIINVGDKFVNTLNIVSEKDNELILFGTFQNKAEGNVAGYFISNINIQSKKVTTNNMNLFPADLLMQLDRDDQGSDNERNGGLSPLFMFNKFLVRENGDRDFILQRQRVYYVSNKYGTVKMFDSGDIIDINVKKDGTNVIARIPKSQLESMDYQSSSFRATTYQDKLLIFYNDSEDNLKQKITSKPDQANLGRYGKRLLGGALDVVLTMACIDANGNLTRTVLMDKTQSKCTVLINNAFAVKNNKIALHAVSRNVNMLGYLNVE